MSFASDLLSRYALMTVLLLLGRMTLAQSVAAPPTPMRLRSSCENLPHPDHPTARLSNGKLTAVVYLPDQERGFYRGSRFDWAGIIGCVALDGHTTSVNGSTITTP
jgi:hypothetical protein